MQNKSMCAGKVTNYQQDRNAIITPWNSCKDSTRNL